MIFRFSKPLTALCREQQEESGMELVLTAVIVLVIIIIRLAYQGRCEAHARDAAEHARDEAVQLLSELRQTAQYSYATGYDHGLDDGHKRGKNESEAVWRKRLQVDLDERYGLN